MLCDWISMRYEFSAPKDFELRDYLRRSCIVVQEVSQETGEVVAEWYKQPKDDEGLASDSHRVTLRVSPSQMSIHGSPARCMGGNNVFGSLDLQAGAKAMLRKVMQAKGTLLPTIDNWILTRVDLTQNYDCGDYVEAALQSLRQAEGGRLRIRNQLGTSYWMPGSDLWQAKAYAKGPHLIKEVLAKRQFCTTEELELSKRLLRFEVKLCNKILRRKGYSFATLTPEECRTMFQTYASKIIPIDASISASESLIQRLERFYGVRQARSLHATWRLIEEGGEALASSVMSRNTWHTHKRLLLGAGLSRADFGARKVVSFRPKAIIARPVDSWADLRRVA